MAKFAGLYLSGLALLSGVVFQACDSWFDGVDFDSREEIILSYTPPDNGGPGQSIGQGTRLHRGSGR